MASDRISDWINDQMDNHKKTSSDLDDTHFIVSKEQIAFISKKGAETFDLFFRLSPHVAELPQIPNLPTSERIQQWIKEQKKNRNMETIQPLTYFVTDEEEITILEKTEKNRNRKKQIFHSHTYSASRCKYAGVIITNTKGGPRPSFFTQEQKVWRTIGSPSREDNCFFC